MAIQILITGNPVLDAVFTLQGLLIFLVLVLAYFGRKSYNLPGPTHWPIIGNTIQVSLNRARFLDWLVELREQHGNTFVISLLPFMSKFVAVSTPENVEYVLKTKFWDFEKGYHFKDKLHEILGYGIFAVDGDLWTVQRKQASHMFSVNSFRNHMTKVFNRNGNRVVQLLDRAAQTGEVIDLQEVFFRFTLDSVGDISFGSNIDSLGDPTVPFSKAFDNAQAIAEKRFWEPWWKVKRLLQIGGERRLSESVKIMNEFSYDVIRRRRAEPEEARAARGDLLSRFMAIKDKQGKPLTDQFLRDIIMNFMIAGRDTTANAMSWMSYMMIKHPEALAKVREEIASLAAEPSYDEIKALTYTRAVFSETLRLYPSVPKDGVQAIKDAMLPDGTCVKKGDLVMFMPYVMGRMPELWGKDCKQFKPERFIGVKEPKAAKFIAFKAGPRTCLGKSMAYFEASSLMSKILARFDFTLDKGFVPHYLPSVTLPMREGLRVRVTRRPNSPM